MKNFNNLYFIKTGIENNIYFFPSSPSPRLDSSGTPMVELIKRGAVSFIQLNTEFRYNEEEKEDLIKFLQLDDPNIKNDDVKLAPFSFDKVELKAGINEERTLATGKTSNIYPFSCLINARVPIEFIELVEDALLGKQDSSRILYYGLFDFPLKIQAKLHLNLDSLLKDWAHKSQEELQNIIQNSILSNPNSFEIESSRPVKNEALNDVRNKLIQNMIQLLLKLTKNDDAIQYDQKVITVSYDETIEEPQELIFQSHLNKWILKNAGQHIKQIS